MPEINLAESVFAFLATYALHSTVWLSLAWLGIRLGRRLCCEHQLALLRMAMAGGILSSVGQATGAVPSLGFQWSLSRAASAVPQGAADDLQYRSAAELGISANTMMEPMQFTWKVLVLVVVAIWAVSIIIHLQRIARDWREIARLRRAGREVTSGLLSRLHAEVATRLGLQRSVQLLLVNGRQSPIVSGYVHPFILVGEDALADLGEGQIRALLAHEQAHVRRFDPCWNLLMEVVRGVFSFQPLNHWAAREIRVQAEFAADRSARNVHDALDLARCLQNFAERRGKSERMLAIGMASPLSNYAHRVVRLLDANDATAPDRRVGWAIRITGGCIALGLVLAGPGLSADSSATALQSETVGRKGSSNINHDFPSDAAGFVGVVEGVLLEKMDRDNFLFEVRSVEELAGDKNRAVAPLAIVGQPIRVRLMPSQRVQRFRRHVGQTPNGGSLRMTIQHTDQDKFDLFFVRSPTRDKSRP